MLLDSQTANEMQAAVEEMFRRLPEHYRTDIIKHEIAKAVLQSKEPGRKGYDKAARAAVYAMFATLDRAIENRAKLSDFVRKTAATKL